MTILAELSPFEARLVFFGAFAAGLVAMIPIVRAVRRSAREERAIRAEAARREAETERLKTELLSNISHELRTPLTPIKGYAQLLKSRALTRARREKFIDTIADQADQLERVIGLLVDVAALESAGPDDAAEPIDLVAVAKQVAAEHSARSSAHSIEVRSVGAPARTAGRARLVASAVDQLLDNAVKFSPGGGRVLVRVVESDGSVDVSVTDEGVGLDPGAVEQIFTDFRQADGSATREFGGLGLGLGLVRRVAEAHGGSLSVKSEPGSGSTFTLRLPIREPQPRA